MKSISIQCARLFFSVVLLSGEVVSEPAGLRPDFPVPEKTGGDLSPIPDYTPGVPPTRKIVLPPVTQEADSVLSRQISVVVERILLSGNTVFSAAKLKEVTEPYVGREITTDELHSLRRELTLYYIERGYINSGAVIPDQNISDGVITIRIIEGRLAGIRVTGNNRLHEEYVRSRLALPEHKPLYFPELQEKVELLHRDRLIHRINAHLVPGLRRGEAVLEVTVEERKPYAFGVSFNNRRSPSVGELRGEIWGSWLNISGYGDAVSFRYGMTEGLKDIAVDYELPLGGRDTRFGLHASRSDSAIIEEPFDAIDITSETENFGLDFSHPFRLTTGGRFSGSIALERRHSKTVFLQNEPYPSPGSENGKTTVAVLRIGQEWLSRRSDRVLAVRSRFSFGLDALGATINRGNTPDARFSSWLGQFQWVQRLSERGTQLVVRSDLQLTNEPLLPLEQFGIGGVTSVRSYRENLMVRDRGWSGTVEVRVPVANRTLQLAAFYDIGGGENVVGSSPKLKNISSAGLGLRWEPNRYIYSQLYWGYALKDVDVRKANSLQDSGFHFSVDVNL